MKPLGFAAAIGAGAGAVVAVFLFCCTNFGQMAGFAAADYVARRREARAEERTAR